MYYFINVISSCTVRSLMCLTFCTQYFVSEMLLHVVIIYSQILYIIFHKWVCYHFSISLWISGLFPVFGYYEQCCCDHPCKQLLRYMSIYLCWLCIYEWNLWGIGYAYIKFYSMMPTAFQIICTICTPSSSVWVPTSAPSLSNAYYCQFLKF